MNSRARKTFASREHDEEPLVVKKETDEHSDEIHGVALSRIKTEPSTEVIQLNVENKLAMTTDHQEFQAAGVIEELFIKNENDQNTEAMSVLNSIKSEPDEVEWDDCEADKINTVELRLANNGSEMEMDRIKNEYDCLDGRAAGKNENVAVKSETDIDSEEFKVAEITEECIIKSGSEASMDAISDTASTSMAKSKFPRSQHQVEYKKAGSKLFSCYHCNNIAYSKRHLISHLKMHNNKKSANSSRPGDIFDTCLQCHMKFKSKTALYDHINREHTIDDDSLKPTLRLLETPGTAFDHKLSICIHCYATFKTKASLDDHIIRKHPDFITNIARKIYECTVCSYKTSIRNNFNNHTSVHGSGYRLNPCIHCNATFKSKVSLDDHILKKHPEFVTSITRKIYECTKCIYKTTIKNHFKGHMSVHPETGSSCICIYCNATLKSKRALDDHVVRKHPFSAAPVGRKIFECTECSYRTIQKSYLTNHMLTHFKTFAPHKLSTCIHCNATFKSTRGLDDHVVKNHPDSIASVARKIHECSKCGYKTILKYDFDKHNASVHSDNPLPFKPRECLHCSAAFSSKMMLDNHVVKKHPDFSASITSKLYECTVCTYKTTLKYDFDRHMSVHLQTTPSYKLSTCTHCNAALKSKRALDDHVLRKHPEFITSVSRKIYDCTICNYKTVHKSSFDKHSSTHVETGSSCEPRYSLSCDT